MVIWKVTPLLIFIALPNFSIAIPRICTPEDMYEAITECSRPYSITESKFSTRRFEDGRNLCDGLAKVAECLRQHIIKIREKCPDRVQRILQASLTEAEYQYMGKCNYSLTITQSPDHHRSNDEVKPTKINSNDSGSEENCSSVVSSIASRCMKGYNERVSRAWQINNRITATIDTCNVVQEVVDCFEISRESIEKCRAGIIGSYDKTVDYMRKQVEVLDCRKKKKEHYRTLLDFARFYESFVLCKAALNLQLTHRCNESDDSLWKWLINCAAATNIQEYKEFERMLQDCRSEVESFALCDRTISSRDENEGKFIKCYLNRFWNYLRSNKILTSE